MITVITPVYNGAEFITETVKSVLRASVNHDVEYIVVNDGSTDKTLEKLQRFGDKIQVLTKVNGGESSAVNLGLRKARGELVLIVSADDPLPSGEVFIGAEDYFTKNSKIVAWYPNWRIIDAEGREIRVVEVDEYSDELLIGRFKCLPGPGTLFRRDPALNIGGRDENWKFVSDYDFWLRLSRLGLLEKRNQIVAQWRFHDQSTSIAQRGLPMAQERIGVIQQFVNSNNLNPELKRQAIAHAYYYAARLCFFDPRIPGRTFLKKALLANRGKISDGKLLVYIFIFTLPFSRLMVPPLKSILRRFGHALT
jgi:glycosyltransferase involved in cell wall biosynthesis